MTTAAGAGEDAACKLLVRALRLNTNSKHELEFEFHTVDLNEKKIELNEITKILTVRGFGMGKLAKFDSSIYIVGNIKNPDELLKQLNNLKVDGDDKDIHIHFGSSRCCLVSKRWETLNSPYLTYDWANPVTISGNLYCFGSPHLLPKVWNRNSNDWKDIYLPAHLIDHKVVTPVIVDHQNNRALFCLFDSKQIIYAFYPNSNSNSNSDNNWRCLVENYNRIWHPVMAVYDNILFIHYFPLGNLVEAYDLNTNQLLQIVGDFSRVGRTRSLYDAIFILPQTNVLCLATDVCRTRTRPASVHIIRLRFNHTSGTNVLYLTALDYQTYDIPPLTDVFDFLLL